MAYQITEGVGIRVEVFYRPEQSNPMYAEFLFAYRISIENLSEYPVQLISRHWDIIDSNNTHRSVDGEGVVGEQPIIMPGDVFRYISAAHLFTDMGKMYGYYTMLNRFNNQTFRLN
jgi:ApaG protein